MPENKWDEINDAAHGYRIENLGRAAYFLIPEIKLSRVMPSGKTVEDDLRAFLIEQYGAFTTTAIPSFGIWRDAGGISVADACRQYRVSFIGKDRIPTLLEKLGEVLRATGEDCLYFEAGQYAGLVYPRPSS